MLKKIISHSFLYAFAPQIPKVISVLLLPVFTKYLTPADYGISATVMAYTGILSGLKDLGITVLLVNSFYHNKKTWPFRWRILYGYMLAWAPIIFLISFWLVWFVIPNEAIDNRFLICLLTSLPLLLFEHSIIVGFRYYHIVQRNPRYISFASIITGLVTVGVTYYVIVVLKLGYLGWMWATFIGTLVSFLFYIYPVLSKLKLNPIFFFNYSFFKKNMKVALPMIPHTYSAYLLNVSDRMVMNVSKVNINNMGIYNLASTFGSYFEILGNSAGLGIGPFITDLIDKKNTAAEIKLRKIIYFFQGLFLLFAFLAGLWMKEIFSVMIANKELQAGYWMAIIIIMGYVYRPMYWGCINRLIYYRKTSKLWKITFVGGLLSLAANFIAIPIFGFQAAIYTAYFALMYVGFSGYFLSDFKNISVTNYYPVRWICIIVLATVVVFLLKDVSIGWKLVVSAITIAGLSIFMKKRWVIKDE